MLLETTSVGNAEDRGRWEIYHRRKMSRNRIRADDKFEWDKIDTKISAVHEG